MEDFMTWIEEKYRTVHENIRDYFHGMALTDPALTLQQVEDDLDCHYFRYGNNWTGRGIVGDTIITATIEALENVRADCLELLKAKQTGQNDSLVHRAQ
jgi:hypothetical protein